MMYYNILSSHHFLSNKDKNTKTFLRFEGRKSISMPDLSDITWCYLLEEHQYSASIIRVGNGSSTISQNFGTHLPHSVIPEAKILDGYYTEIIYIQIIYQFVCLLSARELFFHDRNISYFFQQNPWSIYTQAFRITELLDFAHCPEF
jgi:hypothetical protein